MGLRRIIIAIDGYSACGKSSTAKGLARLLGYRYIDSGAMYRAVTLRLIDRHVSLSNAKEVGTELNRLTITFRVSATGASETYLDGLRVEDDIRTMRVSEKVSEVSAVPEVRRAMVDQQRRMGRERGVVMDGRDIGTVVFPQAELKFFMTADLVVRAVRRQKELLQKGDMVDLDLIIDNLVQRDRMDTTRKESPLVQAPDAVVIDTTPVTLEEQTELMYQLALSRILKD
jgi:cytidylate kinase